MILPDETAAEAPPLTYTVDAPAAGRLDAWLAAQFDDRARNQIQKDILEGHVLVNGKTQPVKFLLRQGDSVEYRIPAPVNTRVIPEDIPLKFLYEDNDVVVIDKPAGLVVHPAPGHPNGTLANALLAHVGPSLVGVGGEGRWGIVHRLDSGTSGLLIAAKTQKAYLTLTGGLADHSIKRDYLGIAVGTFQQGEGSVDLALGRRRSDRKKMGVVRGGKEARTDWKALLQDNGLSLVRLSLHTGRTHQIRVHLQALGRPIIGDPDYGWTRPRTLAAVDPTLRATLAGLWPKRPLLHAARLRLEHPTETGRQLEFNAPAPPDFDPIAKLFWGDDWRARL